MTPEQLEQAEIQAQQLQAGTQQQQKESVVGDVLEIAVEVADALASPGDLFSLVVSGVRAAASGAADMAASALDAAGTAAGNAVSNVATGVVDAAGAVVGGTVDVAGSVVSGAADAAGAVVGGVVEVVAAILD